jgi:hypothetical protein
MPENWRRRQAVQIVAQLPEDPEDALAVLELARSLVESFLIVPQPTLALDRAASVVAFPASASSR